MLMLVRLFLCAFFNLGQGQVKNLRNIYLNSLYSRFQLFYHFLVWLLSSSGFSCTFLKLMSRKYINIRQTMMMGFIYVMDHRLKTLIQNALQTLLCSCSVVKCTPYAVFAIVLATLSESLFGLIQYSWFHLFYFLFTMFID